MAANEHDLRLDILNALLTTPHRQLGQVWPVHQDMARKDPRFYVRLAAWYNDHGDVRDHKEMFVVNLVLSAPARSAGSPPTCSSSAATTTRCPTSSRS
jgi:hypothetical protein